MTPRKYRVRLAKPDRMEALQGWLRAHPRFVRTALFALVGLTFLGAGLGAGSWQSVCRDCPSIAQIYVWEPKVATQDPRRATGGSSPNSSRSAAHRSRSRRCPHTCRTLSSPLRTRSFYRHNGYSLRGILRAVVVRNRSSAACSAVVPAAAARSRSSSRGNMFTEDIGFEQRPARKLQAS